MLAPTSNAYRSLEGPVDIAHHVIKRSSSPRLLSPMASYRLGKQCTVEYFPGTRTRIAKRTRRKRTRHGGIESTRPMSNRRTDFTRLFLLRLHLLPCPFPHAVCMGIHPEDKSCGHHSDLGPIAWYQEGGHLRKGEGLCHCRILIRIVNYCDPAARKRRKRKQRRARSPKRSPRSPPPPTAAAARARARARRCGMMPSVGMA